MPEDWRDELDLDLELELELDLVLELERGLDALGFEPVFGLDGDLFNLGALVPLVVCLGLRADGARLVDLTFDVLRRLVVTFFFFLAWTRSL